MVTVLLALASATFGFWVGQHRDRRAEEVSLAGSLLDELTVFQQQFNATAAGWKEAAEHTGVPGRREQSQLLGASADRLLWRAIALGFEYLGRSVHEWTTEFLADPIATLSEAGRLNDLYFYVFHLRADATRVVAVPPLRRLWDRVLRRPTGPPITVTLAPEVIEDLRKGQEDADAESSQLRDEDD